MGFVVAIDGPAASGKGALAHRLGLALGLPVLDTGLLYRAVADAVLRQGGDLDDEATSAAAAAAFDIRDLDPARLRTAAMGEAASRVAAHPAVRQALIKAQRDFAAGGPGAILDGRDIGTVIVPHAQAKLYVTASPDVRARRRWLERKAAGEAVELETILAEIRRRDARDAGRQAAPLAAAADAVLLDTSELDIDAAFDAARRIVEAARARAKAD